MHLTIICNPVSGRGKALKRARILEQLAEAHHHQVHFIATKSADDLKTIDTQIPVHTDVIISAGGDGTLNALINGLQDPSRIPITVLATGTANLLARELNIPLDPPALLQMIEKQNVVHFDLITVNDAHRALLVVSVGFDAMVIDEIHHNRKGALGFRGYLKPIVSTIRNYIPPELAVYFDGHPDPHPAQLAVVSNVKHYAAFFSITDQAQFDSGQLDVCLFKDASPMGILKSIPAARARRLSKSPAVDYHTAQQIEIKSPTAIPVEIDGEYFGTTPIKITLQANHLPILVPRNLES